MPRIVVNINLRCVFVVFSCFMVSGCGASLASFEEISDDERAHFICKHNQNIRDLSKQADEIAEQVVDSRLVIEQGYRTHKSCQNIPSVVPVTNCTSFGYISCTTTTKTVYNLVCSEIPVPIDGDLEQKKLDGYLIASESAETAYSHALNECLSPLLDMTAEESFAFYQGIQDKMRRARQDAKCEQLKQADIYPLPKECVK